MNGKETHYRDTLRQRGKSFLSRLGRLFGTGELDNEFFDDLEEALISGDVGMETTLRLVETLKEETRKRGVRERQAARLVMQELLARMLEGREELVERAAGEAEVILLVGVNGSGKTTSAAKLAYYYQQQGRNPLLVAGDTFRAAAVEQLAIWAERAGVELIKQQQGSDPSALFYDALNSARARNYDLVIGDTAGRLHNRANLMAELNKIYRVVGRVQPGAPHRVLLVVDATTGQNAVNQAISFNETLPLSALILTKLDGTARGGIVVEIRHRLQIPVAYIGTGERLQDLSPFDSLAFTEALLGDTE